MDFSHRRGTEKDSYVATCVEVYVGPSSRRIKIVRIVQAFECGAVINSSELRNQIEGAIIQGLGGGLLGAITSRTGFFLSSFQRWREEIVLGAAQPTVFADLGYGVLDDAMVETAAYCLQAK